MEKLKLGITTDCVCDLPQKTLKECHIDLIPFHIETDYGRFEDLAEVTSDNILEYIDSGHKALSIAPSIKEYQLFFEKELTKYERVLHITISSGLSEAYDNACLALSSFEDKVIVIDSHHLSTGMGHLLLRAVQLKDAGKEIEVIQDELLKMRNRISTSFIAYSADYLFYNDKISKNIAALCRYFKIHPILKIAKDGRMVLGGFHMGSYEEAANRYIAHQLKHHKYIDRSCLFITHAGCSTKLLRKVRDKVEKYNCVDNIQITTASATVSCNCGPNTFGLLFVQKDH